MSHKERQGMTAAVRSRCLSGHHHPSKSEAAYCNWLLARKQNNEIEDYKIQQSMPIAINGRHWKDWKIDFMVYEIDGTKSYHECKGWNFSDDSFRLKRDAFLLCYPFAKLYINKELYTRGAKKSSVRSRAKALKDMLKRSDKIRKARLEVCKKKRNAV